LSAVLLFAAPAPGLAQSPYAHITEKQVEDYLQAFIDLAMWVSGKEPQQIGEEKPGRIRKYPDVMRVRVIGDTSFVLPKLRDVVNVIGIKLVVLSPGDTSENLLIEHRDDIFFKGQPGKGGCDTFDDHNPQGEYRAHLLIDPFSEQHCFDHELGHAI